MTQTPSPPQMPDLTMPNPLGLRLKALPPSLDTIRMERLARQEELRKSKTTTASPERPKFPGYTPWLKQVNPELNWDYAWLKYVRDQLARVTRGELKRLAISVPPQHGKTTAITERYPLWRMLREPGIRVGIGSYNQWYANKIAHRTRRIARRLGLQFDSNRAEEWDLVNGSSYVARGVGAGISGIPLDLFVIDDPFRGRKDADSETVQERVYEWYMDDVVQRLQKDAALVLIMTRWNPGDLIGRIQESAETHAWEFVRLPAVAETQAERDQVAARTYQPLGLPDPIGRKPGQALCPERYPIEALESRRLAQGVGFESTNQQNPVPRGGMMFDRTWFGTPVPCVPQGKRVARIRYWDLASSRKDSACFTSGVLMACVWDEAGRKTFYVEDVIRGRWHVGERNNVIAQTAQGDQKKSGYSNTYFEAPTHDLGKEASQAITSVCAGLRVYPDSPSGSGSKELRAEPAAAAAKAGLIRLVAGSWNAAYLSELEAFPKGTYKDQCLPAETPILAKQGRTPIFEIRVGDEVWTRFGWRSVLWSGMTSPESDTIVVELDDGGVLECTEGHPVYVIGRGFVPAGCLSEHDWVLSCRESKQSNGMVSSGEGIRTLRGETTGFITPATGVAGRPVSTGPSTSRFTAPYPEAASSIIETTTHSITTSKTSNFSTTPTTRGSIPNSGRFPPRSLSGISTGFDLWPPSGTRRRKVWNGIPGTASLLRNVNRSVTSPASGVGRSSDPDPRPRPTAREFAANGHDRRGRVFIPVSANGAETGSLLPSPVNRFAPTRVVAVRGGRRGVPVYNLTVNDIPEFVAHGVLVHNCDGTSGAFNKLALSGGDAPNVFRQPQPQLADLSYAQRRGLFGLS